MKKFLLDPSKNFYKANMHCHSVYSDGKQTVEELKEDYLKHGYSVVAFTDHEHLVDNSHLNDDNFLAITSCELAIKEFGSMSALVKRDMKVCHLNVYALDPHNINTPCYNHVYDHFVSDTCRSKINVPSTSYKREYSHKGISEMIKKASEAGFLVSYNHPRWSMENATDYLGYKGLWAMEILNSDCWDKGYFEYDINTYDDFLRSGEKIACVAGDDNHTKDHLFLGHIMINSAKLEYGEVMEALSNHNFYASTGARINSLYIEDNVAHISAPDAKYIVMTTGIRDIEKKEVAKEPNSEDITFTFKDNYKYIRFDVVNEDGTRANTCAYFI